MGKIRDLDCFDESVSQKSDVIGSVDFANAKRAKSPRLAEWPPISLNLTICLMVIGSIGRNIGYSYGAVPYANTGVGRPARQIDSVSLVLWQGA